MSEVRLVIRELNQDWSGTIHGSSADRAIAALSADPTTLDELERAFGRFEEPSKGFRPLSNLRRGSCDTPYDAGLVVIDLIARLIVVESTYSSPSRRGSVDYHNGQCCTNSHLRYHLADDWLICRDRETWRTVSEKRRKERTKEPLRDARIVFYGRAMVEFVVQETFAAFARREEIAADVRSEWADPSRHCLAVDSDRLAEDVDARQLTEEEILPKTPSGSESDSCLYHDAISQIHANWMLTPREDLGGFSPREIALSQQNHISLDLQDRGEQWSVLGFCPPSLEVSSQAFRYGGFGTHELVEYYELVRELLWSCWERLTEMADSPEFASRMATFTVGDFLTDEVPRLERFRENWLDGPDLEFHGRTPRSIIENERARIPEVVSGKDAMVDADCPCCQMLADMPGPMFWHLDGCNMDYDFAFDMEFRTREEWEAEQLRWREFNRRFDAEREERKSLGVAGDPAEEGSTWSRCWTIGETNDVPLGVRVFGIGCKLAEIIVGLRDDRERETVSMETRNLIDQLNRDFGNLREILQATETSLAETMIQPVIDHFVETLTSVAQIVPNLDKRCDNLSKQLQRLADPTQAIPDFEADDSDVPF